MRFTAAAIWSLFDRSADCYLQADHHGVIRRANRAAVAFLGMESPDLGPMAIATEHRIERDDDGNYRITGFPSVLGQAGRIPLSLPNGRRFEAVAASVCEENEEPCYLLLIRPLAQGTAPPAIGDEEVRPAVIQARLALLAEASQAFTEASLDLEALMEIVSRSISSYVGDTCVIRLLSEDRLWLHAVAVNHPNPEARDLARKVNSDFSQRADSGPVSIVVNSGLPLLVPRVDQEELRMTARPEYLSYLDRVGVTSLIMAPLRVRGRVIGTLGVARDHGGESYTVEDQTLLQELADRAAMAVENARLYRAIQEELAERKRAEERYRLVTRATSDVVWDWDMVKDTIWRSTTMQTLFGYMPGEVLPDVEWWLNHIHPEDRDGVMASVRGVKGGGEEYWSGEYRFLRSDGVYAHILDKAQVLRDEAGRAVRMIGAMTDVSQAKQTEAALRHAHDILVQRVEERTAEVMNLMHRIEETRTSQVRFVADASHDLRTPLTIVRAELDLLRLRPGHDIRTRESLERIDTESKRLDQLASDLLFLATIDALTPDDKRQPVQLEELAIDAVSDLSMGTKEKDLVWNIQIDETPEVLCSRQMMRRALLSVLDNAVRYSPAGGTIRMEIGVRDGELRLEVEDAGCGISGEDLPHVFDRFYRADPARTRGGSGLGLTIVKSVFEAHDGRVEIESELERGTLVRLILPL